MKHLQSALILLAFVALISCSGGQDNKVENDKVEISQEEQQEVEALEELSNEVQETTESLNEEAEKLENDLDSLLK